VATGILDGRRNRLAGAQGDGPREEKVERDRSEWRGPGAGWLCGREGDRECDEGWWCVFAIDPSGG